MNTRSVALRYLGRAAAYIWALPTTLFGLVVVLIAFPGGCRMEVHNGAIEVRGRAIRWMLRYLVPLSGGAAALTLGHVILGRTDKDLARCRYHEHVHVRQAERWGILFLPAYLLLAIWIRFRGRHPYYDHPFEREAFVAERLRQTGGSETEKAA